MKHVLAAILVFSSVSLAADDYKKVLVALKKETRAVCREAKKKPKNKRLKVRCDTNGRQIRALKKLINQQKKERVCYLIYTPVCGVDLKTYSNRCFADSEGVEVLHEGECS